jgi:ubiquinone/menaquinone biosynthesis C-methylase UbiE
MTCRLSVVSLAAFALVCLSSTVVGMGGQHDTTSREAVDRMRDKDLQPDRVLDVMGVRPGMTVGEAGASYGYFTFKLAARVGPGGRIYANDIDPSALRSIEARSASEKVQNVTTVLGEVADPRFPRTDLDLIVVFDCLFEFADQAGWMQNARRYLKAGGRLIVVDPDRSKMPSSHFLSRRQIEDFGRQAGYSPVTVDDRFLKSHMIVVLAVTPPGP